MPDDWLPQMPLRESDSGTGLQVPFELHRTRLVNKFDDDVDVPRTAVRRVGTVSCIVRCKSCSDVPCKARVIALGCALALENVYEAFGEPHAHR